MSSPISETRKVTAAHNNFEEIDLTKLVLVDLLKRNLPIFLRDIEGIRCFVKEHVLQPEYNDEAVAALAKELLSSKTYDRSFPGTAQPSPEPET